MRTSADGAIDASFEPQLVGRVLLPPTVDTASAAMPLADGKLMVSGSNEIVAPENAFLARLNEDGSPDSGFANAGLATAALGQDVSANFTYLAPTKRRGWLLAGQYSHGIVLVRFTASGDADDSFGTNGVVLLQVGVDGAFLPKRAAMQPDGKLVIAGSLPNSSLDSTPHFAVVRVLADYDTLFVDGFEATP